MDEHAMAERRSSSIGRIPWPVWLLLAGAVVQLGVAIAPDSYSVFGPYLLVDAGMVLEWLRSISPFLLAAAIVLGADRWPAGRRRLLIGAGVLAVVALLHMAGDIWWALWEASGHVWDVNQPWLLGGFVAAAILFVIAHLLLAAGLWTARANLPMGVLRAAGIAVIGLGSVAAIAVGGWVVVRILAVGPADHLAYSVSMMSLMVAGLAALALLALAAVRVAPQRGGLAEILIAAGAVLTMAASAWSSSFPNLTPLQEVPEEMFFWLFTVPNAAEVAGWLTMIAGFAVAAVVTRRRVDTG